MLRYRLYDARTPRRIVFRIATSATSLAENVLLRISDGAAEGWGAACVNSVTGETFESIHQSLPVIVDAANQIGSTDPQHVLPQLAQQFATTAPAALTAFDTALYDLASRRQNLPLCQYLARQFGSTPRRSVATDNTIFIEPLDVTLRLAAEHLAAGFRVIKLKVGLDYELERQKVVALRKLAGPDVAIYADANQGYGVAQGLDMAKLLAEQKYLFFEQPVDKNDLDGLQAVAAGSPLPIYADEAARTLELAGRICREKIAGGLNIKLTKFGGIRQGIEVLRLAAEHGLETMVGCYGELSLSLAAAAHFAMAFPRVKVADLDSHFTLIDEPCSGLLLAKGGRLHTQGAGLGIEVRIDKLQPAG